MLDETGIRLDEVTRKYPRVFQTLGYDLMLDVDALNKPKVVSTFQLCINSILTLLFMKPGQYPSIPEIGLDIEQYLHDYSDRNGILKEIRDKLYDQCNVLNIVGITFDCQFDKTSYGKDALVITVTGTDRVAYGSEGNRAIIGISYDQLNKLYAKIGYV